MISSIRRLDPSNDTLDLDTAKNENVVFTKESENLYFYKQLDSGREVEISKEPFLLSIKDSDGQQIIRTAQELLSFTEFEEYQDYYKLTLNFENVGDNFYGFGEKYDSLNQQGLTPDICVYNQYLNQGEKTYIPIPFFWTVDGFGVYVDSSQYLKFDLAASYKDVLSISGEISKEQPFMDYSILFGSPEQIIKEYFDITGYPKLPPKWSFGPWMSANGWRSQKDVEEQIEYMNKYQIPASVFVIEAWSDEATFYTFNDAKYEVREGNVDVTYDDFDFLTDGKWPNPKVMVDKLHNNGLKLLLWQIPIIRELEEGVTNPQHDIDESYVIEKEYCVKNADGTPYRVTDGWFTNSLLLDFNNSEACKWWFDRRKYLVDDLGIDGFKTDGGEFIFDSDLVFADGKKGREMKNLYALNYIKAYHDFINEDMITFSRTGFTGLQKYPLYWGGDQNSTSFEVLRKLIIAGLSLNISGNPFWGWDIGGFSGEIPTAELYIRSTQMATFCPLMQFHSENYKESKYCWDRTPWNIAERTGNQRVIEIYRKYANLRMNLLPYIYDEAVYLVNHGELMMRPLVYDYPEDVNVYNLEDEYLFGRKLLIAPIVEENQRQRIVYLPVGKWIDFWTGEEYNGGINIKYKADIGKIPVFIKNNTVIPLNLDSNFELLSNVGNGLDHYQNLSFLITGEIGEYTFNDDLGNQVSFDKDSQGRIEVKITGTIEEVYLVVRQALEDASEMLIIEDDNMYVYKILRT